MANIVNVIKSGSNFCNNDVTDIKLNRLRSVCYALLIFFSQLNYTPVFSQPGTPDATFNTADTGDQTGFGPLSGDVETTLVLSDGKILIAGNFVGYNNSAVGLIARLNADGTIDTGFNIGGTGFNGTVIKLLLQPDGKIITIGYFTQYNGVNRRGIARLNSDGSLDATFDPGTGIGVDDYVKDVAFQNEKIILIGDITSYNNTTVKSIIRINVNGSLDTTFAPADASFLYSIKVQSDGKIVVGGLFNTIGGQTRYRLARLNSNGSLDTGFNPGNAVINEGIYAILIQPDGKIVVGGSYSQTSYKGLIRLNSNGSIDNSFGITNGPLANYGEGYINVIQQQTDGKFLVGGQFNSFNGAAANYITRINNNGSADTGFNVGEGGTDEVRDVKVLASGKVLVAGWFLSFNNKPQKRLVLLNSNGSIDTSFNPVSGTGANSNVYVTRNLSSGKKIIAGSFTVFNGTPVGRIARLNEDGSLDLTYNTANGGANEVIYDLAVQNDGKLIVAGEFTKIAGQARSSIARLNADGTLDGSFNAGLGANSYIYSVAVQSDGKILAAGYIGSSTRQWNLVRYNSDGSPDNTFNANNSQITNGLIRDIVIQPDGAILFGGGFTTAGGSTYNRIARLTAAGLLDTSFNPGTGANSSVMSISVQPDGKILVGGFFSSFNGLAQSVLVRLNPNGSLDNGFVTAINVSVRSIKNYPDGKIAIGGGFTTVNGVSRNRLAVLNADGSLNTTFDPGVGVNDLVLNCDMEPNGDLLIGGLFNQVGTLNKNYIARVKGIPILVAEPTASPTNLQFNSVGPTSFNYSFTPSTPAAEGYLHLRKEGSAPTEIPVDGVAYTQGQVLGSSTVVFTGAATANTQTSMATGTTYHYAIYAYNGSGSVINYRTASPATGSVTPTNLATEPTTQPTNLVFSEIKTTSFKATFTAAAPAPAGYLGVVSQGTPTAPLDGTIYLAGQSVGNGIVSFVGTTTTNTIINLQKSTNYTLTVYSYNGTGTTVNYRQTAPLSNSVTTAEVDCTQPPKPTITASGLETESPTLTSSALQGNQWYLNNEIITGATLRTLAIAGIGSYTVKVTVEGGCVSNSSDPYAIVITGDLAGNQQPDVRWYPNPATDKVMFETQVAGAKLLRIVDNTGRTKERIEFEASSQEVNLTGYSEGIFYFVLQSATGTTVGKIYKRK